MGSPRHSWLRIRRSTRVRAVYVLRLVLCAVLVFRLLPASDELVETITHLVHDGHLPHSSTHDQVEGSEECDGGDEHGCTPLAHHCKCCASSPGLPAQPHPPDGLLAAAQRVELRFPHERGPPNDGVKPVLPPPIA